MESERKSIKLRDLMVIVFLVGVLGSVVVPALAASRKLAKKRDCTNNLRILGTYLAIYCSRCGCDRSYPPSPPHNFFNTLRRVPAAGPLVQDDGLFICAVLGGAPSPTRLDYRNANPAAYGAQQTTDGVTKANYPIGADKTTNHDIEGNDDVNVLLFSGSVIAANPGDVNWSMAITQNYTQ